MYKMKTGSQGPTVTFNNHFVGVSAEEDVYANAEMCTVDERPATTEKKIPPSIQSLIPVAVCWGILLIIMALRIHFTSVISTMLSDQMEGSEEAVQQCKNVIDNLALANNNLKSDQSTQDIQIEELAQANAVLKGKITQLREENQQVKTENQQLKEENQQVKDENQKVKAENQQLKEENQQVKDENQKVKAENQQLKDENQQVKDENQKVKAENQKVKAENQQLKDENQRVKDENQKMHDNFSLKPIPTTDNFQLLKANTDTTHTYTYDRDLRS
ncbi:golgin subfamily A member 6-like protein 4 [Dicentrarchus labrax]|uniref:golgin subfamily A member 6-like protein 4 n=1 Tax=Dicentrarchus labrax TaxID=13489 RepID=UPI0021F52D45|nr:golgin subfamily A member 6-like protein 4 [Dicentrarchus labrax]